jgi:hypothetical protein
MIVTALLLLLLLFFCWLIYLVSPSLVRVTEFSDVFSFGRIFGELLVKCYVPVMLSTLYSPSATTKVQNSFLNTNVASSTNPAFATPTNFELASLHNLLPQSSEAEWSPCATIALACCSPMPSLRPQFEDLAIQFKNINLKNQNG